MVQNLILQRTILTENQELEAWYYKKIFVGSFVIKFHMIIKKTVYETLIALGVVFAMPMQQH